MLTLALALASAASWQARGAGLVPDGATATTVSSTPAGKAVIAIAPPVAGVSHNTYSSFNVGRAGADLQNSGVSARYIVNEVTSTRPSLIEGPIAVVGPRASVILANPHGITLNGASFVNTGNVAITTGRVRFHDLNPAPGIVQRNIVLTTDQGVIEIGPEGLAGAFANLELIAKRLKVGGPVTNTFTSADARVRAVLGDSRAEVDTSVSPDGQPDPLDRLLRAGHRERRGDAAGYHSPGQPLLRPHRDRRHRPRGWRVPCRKPVRQRRRFQPVGGWGVAGSGGLHTVVRQADRVRLAGGK
ncbi:MAG: filamentous hemagglutinin N-terminal domain-containing protein [Comamonadaceae bacterium]|nr:filamentous hemagglutinin N-terminal domain-containing protein [Comamonadaceae bacterium]